MLALYPGFEIGILTLYPVCCILMPESSQGARPGISIGTGAKKGDNTVDSHTIPSYLLFVFHAEQSARKDPAPQ